MEETMNYRKGRAQTLRWQIWHDTFQVGDAVIRIFDDHSADILRPGKPDVFVHDGHAHGSRKAAVNGAGWALRKMNYIENHIVDFEKRAKVMPGDCTCHLGNWESLDCPKHGIDAQRRAMSHRLNAGCIL